MKLNMILTMMLLVVFTVGCGKSSSTQSLSFDSLAKAGGIFKVQDQFRAEQYSQAIRTVDSALKINDYDDKSKALLLFYKAQSLGALQEQDDAVMVYQHIASTYPKTEQGLKSSEILKSLKVK